MKLWLMGMTAVALLSGETILAQQHPAPPETRVEDVRDRLHGVEVVDPYRWLEDQQSPETREWIASQNAHTEAVLGEFAGRDRIAKRLSELLRVDSVSMPTVRGTRYFFTRRRADQDLPVICMREGHDGDDQVLVDPHTLSDDGTRTVSILDVSRDGSLLIYGIREGGEDEIAVHFLDVETRQTREDHLPRGRYFGVALTPDEGTLYYTEHSSEDGSRVYERAFGVELGEPRQIFGDGYGPGNIIYPSLSHEGKYLFLNVLYGSAAPKSDIYYRDRSLGSEIRPLVNDIEARFEGYAVGDRMWIKTDWDAPNGRILVVDLKHPERENWRELVPESKAVLEDYSLVGGRLFVNFLDNVVSRVTIFDVDGKRQKEIRFPTLGSVSGVGGEWNEDEAFFSFSSFAVPPTIYRYQVAQESQDVWARVDAPVDSDAFETSQVWFTSKDGTRVPMFLVHRKGLERDGARPTLLTGYGGFNISRTPGFSATAVVWIEQGGVFAVANLRGGGEFGEEWHRAGMLDRKQNVFDDFFAAAEWLIDQDYTSSQKLAIAGGSNGGLLVGAALTQRPELFRAVVCSYPLLDMLRFHLFLVARFWVPEYGSSEDAEQFAVLRRYSPYHNVTPGTEYPAVLLVTGDSDTRVDPLHARKMAALLQAADSKRPVLLRYDTKLGHSGGRPVSQQIEDLTYELSFLFDQLDVAVTAD